jgi:uncharacterized protein (TIGR04255 family)
VEAVIDFRVIRDDGVSPETFAGLGPSIGVKYSQKSEMHSIQAQFGLTIGGPVASSSMEAVIGWLYRTETELAQFRVDGFTFSKIEPYTTWERVFGEALRLWRVYIDAARPKQVSRIAVRYINRMRLPVAIDLRLYLEGPPSLPEPIPQTIREFLSRVVVDDDSRKAKLDEIRNNFLASYVLRNNAERALAELDEVRVEASRPGWDGYGALALNPFSYGYARRFLSALPTTAPTPEISADTDGEVSLDWIFGNRRALSVSIGPTGRCTFAWMLGQRTTSGTEWIEDEIPASIAWALGQLAPDTTAKRAS